LYLYRRINLTQVESLQLVSSWFFLLLVFHFEPLLLLVCDMLWIW
jgi:hypothetical protein